MGKPQDALPEFTDGSCHLDKSIFTDRREMGGGYEVSVQEVTEVCHPDLLSSGGKG